MKLLRIFVSASGNRKVHYKATSDAFNQSFFFSERRGYVTVRDYGKRAFALEETTENGTVVGSPIWVMSGREEHAGDWSFNVTQTASKRVGVAFNASATEFPEFEVAHCPGIPRYSGHILDQCYANGMLSPWTRSSTGEIADVSLSGISEKNFVFFVRGVYADGTISGFRHETMYVHSALYQGVINVTVTQDHDGSLFDSYVYAHGSPPSISRDTARTRSSWRT